MIPLFLLLVITAFGGPEGYFSLAIIAFGASGFIGNGHEESGLLNLRRLRFSTGENQKGTGGRGREEGDGTENVINCRKLS